MRTVTPIAPIHGKANVFSDILSPEHDHDRGLDKNVTAVAIVLEEDVGQPYYVVNVDDNGDWYPALTFGLESTQTNSPWEA